MLGEAGVGKSRLAREIVALARIQGFHVLFGRAVRAETPVPCRPLAGAFLSHFRREGPPSAPELAPYRAVRGRLVPKWRSPAAAAVEPDVVLAEAVARLLRVVAGDVGCLVVLEDLQWADPEFLAVVEYLADALSTEPMTSMRDPVRVFGAKVPLRNGWDEVSQVLRSLASRWSKATDYRFEPGLNSGLRVPSLASPLSPLNCTPAIREAGAGLHRWHRSAADGRQFWARPDSQPRAGRR
jgi:hypothetical protein